MWRQWASPEAQADQYVRTYGGEPLAYLAILTETDCQTLQVTFDQAAENQRNSEVTSRDYQIATGYMVAADQRMTSLDCSS